MAASLAAGVVLAVSPMRRIIAGGGWGGWQQLLNQEQTMTVLRWDVGLFS
jgi:hypothetical protein